MKRLLLLLTIAYTLITLSANAQAPIIFQNLNAINRDVQYISDSTLVIVGDHGKIIRTDNGGKSWKWQECYRRANLKKLHFLNPQSGFIVGDSGLILHTNSYGKFWEFSYLPTQWLGGVFAVSESVAIAVGAKGSIFRSADAGKTWNQVYADTSIYFNDVQFTNQLFGTVVGSDGVMLRTLDGGQTWKQIYSEPLLDITRVKFVNQRYGYVSGGSIRYATTDTSLYYSLRIMRTTDGGTTWNLQGDTSSTDLLFGLAAQDTINATVCGIGSRIFHTNNSGAVWKRDTLDFSAFVTELSRPTRLYLCGVSFLDSEHGVLVGNDNIIAFTTNKSDTWVLHSYAKITTFIDGDRFVYDIKFNDNDNAVILMGAGNISQTSDGGVTSMRRFPLITDNIISIRAFWAGVHFSSPTNVIAIGLDAEGKSFGKLTVRSTDAGKTWVRTDELHAFTMSFPSPLRGYLGVSGTKKIKVTSDGGATWEALEYPGWTAKTHPFLTDDLGFVSSSQSKNTDDTLKYPSGTYSLTKIYRTSDGGASFNEVFADSSSGYVNSVCARDDNTIFAVGRLNGQIARSDDKGLTWTLTPSPQGSEINKIYFQNSRIGFMIDVTNNLMMTTNGGETWKIYPIPYFQSYEGEPILGYYDYIIKGNNDSTFYLSGINRFVRCIIPREILNDVEEPKLSEGTFNPYFYIQTQPIPAANSMEVKLFGLYSVKNQPLSVKVFNMLGVEVGDFSREANAGNNGSYSTFNADVSKLGGGVYVLQYSAGGYSKSGLFVVAR
ncbi:MAG: hypothetical protein JST20_14495 [Bacteroidetes bacterium]|nr:hypothetical protein [Bacteroidota bacterium]